MAKEKFVYNALTLTYEKVQMSVKKKFIRGFGVFSAAAVFATMSAVVGSRLVDSPKEKELKSELEIMRNELKVINKDVQQMTSLMTYLRKKDASVYRLVLESAPTDDKIWKNSKFDKSQYDYLKFNQDRELVASSAERISKLQKMMFQQNQSYDELIALVKDKERVLSSVPSIIPVKRSSLRGRGNLSVLSGFGMRVHPVYKIARMHAGIDLTAPTGTPIVASASGVVVRVQQGYSGGYGNNVVIDHGNGYQTLYAHMHTISCRVGNRVKRGQELGTVGSTGLSTGPHLHYEVNKGGVRLDPKQFLLDGLTPAEYEEIVSKASMKNQSFD
jgi:murein DD-endopeptidase MepM/ murein hydrolase activator NlpD